MTLDEASRLFEYDDWANIKLLAMLSNIFGEETDLSANADSRISSLRKTALHMVAGSAFWRTRIQPDARSEKISSEEYTTVLEIGFAFCASYAVTRPLKPRLTCTRLSGMRAGVGQRFFVFSPHRKPKGLDPCGKLRTRWRAASQTLPHSTMR